LIFFSPILVYFYLFTLIFTKKKRCQKFVCHLIKTITTVLHPFFIDGCKRKNILGNTVIHPKRTILRVAKKLVFFEYIIDCRIVTVKKKMFEIWIQLFQCNQEKKNEQKIVINLQANLDWAGQCTKWCTCDSNKKLSCTNLGCLKGGLCQAPNATLEFGEQIYIKNRGACFCHSGNFICELPEEPFRFEKRLYLLVGYSQNEIDMLREKIPARKLEEAFYFSSDSLERNLAKALQNAFESYISTVRPPFILSYTVEWQGISRFRNDTRRRFHRGPDAKRCSIYVQALAKMIARNEVPHSQLLLSTVKQIRVLDFLRGLPDNHFRVVLLTFLLDFLTLTAFFIVRKKSDTHD
uniref:Phlebovirus_G2 domain-containing protein n=1 Tax=Enterobius vermicularis TaxID=51028 RepID=A0A0N4VLN5_ENTVE